MIGEEVVWCQQLFHASHLSVLSAAKLHEHNDHGV